MHSFGSLSAPFVLDPETLPDHSVKSAWFANADLNWCQQANARFHLIPLSALEIMHSARSQTTRTAFIKSSVVSIASCQMFAKEIDSALRGTLIKKPLEVFGSLPGKSFAPYVEFVLIRCKGSFDVIGVL